MVSGRVDGKRDAPGSLYTSPSLLSICRSSAPPRHLFPLSPNVSPFSPHAFTPNPPLCTSSLPHLAPSIHLHFSLSTPLPPYQHTSPLYTSSPLSTRLPPLRNHLRFSTHLPPHLSLPPSALPSLTASLTFSPSAPSGTGNGGKRELEACFADCQWIFAALDSLNQRL